MTTKQKITIPSINIQYFTFKVKGITPLIVHRWSEKAKKQILDKHTKKAKTQGHDIRNPVAEFIDSLYWLEGEPKEKNERAFEEAIKKGAKFGFPAIGFKAAAVAAGYRAGVLRDKVSSYAAFHIDCEFVQINGIPQMREDMVVIGSGVNRSSDLRYRGEFREWSAEIPIKYNAGAISAEQIASLFNLGGFSSGIGEWRVEKRGNFGMFCID